EEALTEFALMAKSSSSFENEVFDNSLYSKSCKKNTDSLNTKIIELSEKLSDCKTNLYHYKLGLSQVEARLVEFKKKEIKFYEKIRGLEFNVESKNNRIERLTRELEELKKEKEGLDSKLTVLFPPPAQVYSPPKKDMSWTGLPEFANDTISDYSRPSPSIESNSNDLQSSNSSVSENGESSSSILSKHVITFVKVADSPTVIKTNKDETVKKYSIKYAEMYKKTSKSFNVRVRTQYRVPRVFTVNTKFPTFNKKFPAGNSKLSTADLGNKGKAVKASACWIWRPKLNSTDKECIVLVRDFKLKDDTNVLLKTPRQHNMYSIDLNNIVPHKDLNCLVAKASADENMLWHMRLGHLNFKTMNKLVRHNLVKGLPSKCFEINHTYVACLKGKQHKASCKTKLVNSMSKPLHTFDMDLFGPTSVSSLNHKWYCLVVTNDFSRFTWIFFLKTKDETSGILRNFITEIETLKDLKVKIIRCDNVGELRNKEMNGFCSRKGIKREFSNARIPQQNRVAEGRNRTLIEAARTMYRVKCGRWGNSELWDWREIQLRRLCLGERYTSHHLDHFTSGSSSSHSSLDHSSSEHSSSGHSLIEHTLPDTTDADLATPPRFVHPPLTRTPQCREAYRCWWSAPLSIMYPPMTSEDSSSESSAGPSRKRCRSSAATMISFVHATRALVPSCVNLLPPRKRFRDSISPEDSVKEGIDTDVLEDIEADASFVEVAVDRDVEDRIDVGIGIEVDVRINVEDEVEDEVESSDRGNMKVGLDVVFGIDILTNMTITRSGMIPGVIEELVSRRVEEADKGNGGNGNYENGNGGKENGNGENGNPNENNRDDRPDELTMMCTKMVPVEEDRVKKFIRDLPDNIQGNVIVAKPMRLYDVVRIANNLMDPKLKGYAMKNAENKRRFDVYNSKVETAVVLNRTREVHKTDEEARVRNFSARFRMELAYVRSAKDETYVQVLESVLVGPINVGNYHFVFQNDECFVNQHSFRLLLMPYESVVGDIESHNRNH
nr:putative ribonuclease H-like domain-containing protein [Tanacetum cinerariifolium]